MVLDNYKVTFLESTQDRYTTLIEDKEGRYFSLQFCNASAQCSLCVGRAKVDKAPAAAYAWSIAEATSGDSLSCAWAFAACIGVTHALFHIPQEYRKCPAGLNV